VADTLKRLARSTVAALAVGSRLWRPVPQGAAVVLRYHRVGANFPLSVTAEEFEGQLRFLRSRCRVVPAGELVTCLREGKPLPPRAVAITFDDGYEDNFTQAVPLLQRYCLPATFFVTTGWIDTEKVLWWDRLHDYVEQGARQGARAVGIDELPGALAEHLGPLATWHEGRPWPARLAPALEAKLSRAIRSLGLAPEETDDLVERIGSTLGADEADPERYRPMTWDQVRSLHALGMEIGSHTVAHALLARVKPERAHRELVESKKRLQAELGAPVALFAYPAGDHNEDAIELVAEAGYQGAFTTTSGPVRAGDNPLTLRRIGVWHRGYRGVLAGFSACVFGLQIGRLARRNER